MAIFCILLIYFLLSLTLLLFKLILCKEDRPHQLPNRWLNGDEEFLGVSAENENKQKKKHFFKSKGRWGLKLDQYCL